MRVCGTESAMSYRKVRSRIVRSMDGGSQDFMHPESSSQLQQSAVVVTRAT